MFYATTAWGIMISAAELIGLSSRPETGVKRPCLVWMFLRELVSISLFAAVLGITFWIIRARGYWGETGVIIHGYWLR